MTPRTIQVAFLLLCTGLALYVGHLLRGVLTPLLLALLLAYILNPFVTALEKRKVSRLTSIGLIYGTFLLFFTIFLLVAVPAAFRQGTDFVEATFLGDRSHPPRVEQWIAWSRTHLQDLLGEDIETFVQKLRADSSSGPGGDWAAVAGKTATVVGKWVSGGVGALFSALSFLVLVPVYLFFFLRGMNEGWERFCRYLPEIYRDRILSSLGKIHRANAAFFRGQLLICTIEGAFLFLVLLLLGVRLSWFFGFLYAATAFIPFLGPVISFASIQIFLLATSGTVGTDAIAVTATFLTIQACESLLLQPMIIGKETGLHPVLIILSILSFGTLFGFFGALLAVPLCSITLILTKDYVLPVFREVTAKTP